MVDNIYIYKYTFIIFRGENLNQSFTIIKTMFDFREFSSSFKGIEILNIIYIFIALVFVLYSKNTLYFISNKKYNYSAALLLFFIAILQINHILISDDKLSKFIYFNF